MPNGETVVSRDPDNPIDVSITDPSLDMAEATLSQGGVLVGNTGFGYGDTDGISESEAVVATFAAHLIQQGTSVGQALKDAKREYLGTLSALTPYDAKSSLEMQLYGMPHYQLPIGTAGQAAEAPATGFVASIGGAAGIEAAAKEVAAIPTPATVSTVPQLLAVADFVSMLELAEAPATFVLTVIDPGAHGVAAQVHTYDLTPVGVGGGTYFTATERDVSDAQPGHQAAPHSVLGRPGW